VSYKILFRTVESPFDNEQGQVLSTENRATQTHRRKRKAATTNRVTRPTSNRRSQKDKQKIDPDIQREIDQHGEDNVNIVYDNDASLK
jgi:hypothetical protein